MAYMFKGQKVYFMETEKGHPWQQKEWGVNTVGCCHRNELLIKKNYNLNYKKA